jgi:hypothetical protein
VRTIHALIFNAFLLSGLLAPQCAHAYVGPGAGLTLIGSLIGLGAAVLAAIGAVLLWPFRRWLKRRKAGAQVGEEGGEGAE